MPRKGLSETAQHMLRIWELTDEDNEQIMEMFDSGKFAAANRSFLNENEIAERQDRAAHLREESKAAVEWYRGDMYGEPNWR